MVFRTLVSYNNFVGMADRAQLRGDYARAAMLYEKAESLAFLELRKISKSRGPLSKLRVFTFVLGIIIAHPRFKTK